MEGLAIHFPEATFRLPTLHLPRLFRLRSNPRMLIDASQAPFVQQPAVAYGAPIAVQSIATPQQSIPPQSAPPQSAPPQLAPPQPTPPQLAPPPACDTLHDCVTSDEHVPDAWQARLESQDRRIESLQHQVSRLVTNIERMADIVEGNAYPEGPPLAVDPPRPKRLTEPRTSSRLRPQVQAGPALSDRGQAEMNNVANHRRIPLLRRLPFQDRPNSEAVRHASFVESLRP
jgi:hypothetical protein